MDYPGFAVIGDNTPKPTPAATFGVLAQLVERLNGIEGVGHGPDFLQALLIPPAPFNIQPITLTALCGEVPESFFWSPQMDRPRAIVLFSSENETRRPIVVCPWENAFRGRQNPDPATPGQIVGSQQSQRRKVWRIGLGFDVSPPVAFADFVTQLPPPALWSANAHTPFFAVGDSISERLL